MLRDSDQHTICAALFSGYYRETNQSAIILWGWLLLDWAIDMYSANILYNDQILLHWKMLHNFHF